MTAYLTRVAAATQALGRAVDCWANAALYGGNPAQTVSEHAALDALAGKPIGCALCRVLSAIVQPNHCQVTLDPNGKFPTSAAIAVGAAFLLLFGLLGAALDNAVAQLCGYLVSLAN